MLLIIIVSDLCIITSSSNLDEEYNTGGIPHMTKILKYGFVRKIHIELNFGNMGRAQRTQTLWKV